MSCHFSVAQNRCLANTPYHKTFLKRVSSRYVTPKLCPTKYKAELRLEPKSDLLTVKRSEKKGVDSFFYNFILEKLGRKSVLNGKVIGHRLWPLEFFHFYSESILTPFF